MKFLIVTDTHDMKTKDLDVILGQNFDALISLGDVNIDHLRYLKSIVPNDKIFTILGNCDPLWYKDELAESYFHMETRTLNGLTFSGYGGALKRRSNPDRLLMTDEESIEDLQNMPSVDILFSHDTIKASYNESWGYAGLLGINQYIEKNQLSLNIHGHHHSNGSYDFLDCKIVGVYSVVLLDIEKIDGLPVIKDTQILL